MKAIAGIDPGLSGSIAVIDGDDSILCLADLPTIKAGKTELDEVAIKDLLSSFSVGHVFVEKVGAMPGQGVVSMFRFGCSWGLIRGLCVGLGLPYTLVTPQRWKGAMMDGMSKDKGASILRAKQLFPCARLDRKKDHGKADALLLAAYGREAFGR